MIREVFSEQQMVMLRQRIGSEDFELNAQHRDFSNPQRPRVRVCGEPVSPSQLYPHGPDVSLYFTQRDHLHRVVHKLMPDFFSTLERFFQRTGKKARRASEYGACTISIIPDGCAIDTVRISMLKLQYIKKFEPSFTSMMCAASS